MKKIFLIRSAKAENFSLALNDFERSLEKEGLEDIGIVGSYLSLQEISVDIFLSSCALRAEETTLALAKDLGSKGVKYFLEELYFKPYEKIINIITAQDDDFSSICIVGHNPQLNELVNILSNEPVGHIGHMTVIALSFDIESWSELESIKGDIEFTISPEKLRYPIQKINENEEKNFKDIDKYLKHNLEKLNIFQKEMRENTEQTAQKQLDILENLKDEIQNKMQKYLKIFMWNIQDEIKQIDKKLSKDYCRYEKIEKPKKKNIFLISSVVFIMIATILIIFLLV